MNQKVVQPPRLGQLVLVVDNSVRKTPLAARKGDQADQRQIWCCKSCEDPGHVTRQTIWNRVSVVRNMSAGDRCTSQGRKEK